MYLSRVIIDTNNRQKIKDLTHLGAYHHWVEQSFPNEFDQDVRTRKLWRIDRLNGKDYLLIVSKNPPEISKLERYGVLGSSETIDYQKFIDQIYDEQIYKFRVVLNPVISKSQPGTRGVVKPHITVEHQLNYLLNRANRQGFNVERHEVDIISRSFEPLRTSGGRLIRINKVTYEGTLKVTDSEVFKQTLVKGFGKKKAYGFGLMTIIPGG